MAVLPEVATLDLKSPANVQDPFPVYRWLREHDPVHWSASWNAWAVTRFDDVLAMLSQPLKFSSDRFRKVDEAYASDRPAVKAVGEILGRWLVFRDPPDHDRLRDLLQRSFTPRVIARSREQIQATADTLLDGLRDRAEADFVREVAFPLPAVVIATLLGAPTADIEEIKTCSDRLAAYLGGAADGRDNFAEAAAGLSGLVDYFRALLRERRAAPRDDLMSLMLAAEVDGDRLSHDEVVANCVLLLFAGHETTTNLLATGLFHLLRHPEQAAAVRADPSLTPNAVEEMLRYDGPVPATIKIATEVVRWHGRTIRAGEMVVPLFSAANRDPRQFIDPERFDVRREIARHLSFAFGLHFCLGAGLARLEAQVVFGTVLRRLDGLRLSGALPRFKPTMFLRGHESLAVCWE